MRPRFVVLSLLLTVVLLCTSCGVGSQSPKSPEDAARLGAELLAQRDWPRYQALALNEADMVTAELGSPEGPGSFVGSVLRPRERERIRREFDAAVSTGRFETLDLSACAAVAEPDGDDRWSVSLLDRKGNPLGIDMDVHLFQGQFRVASVRLSKPASFSR